MIAVLFLATLTLTLIIAVSLISFSGNRGTSEDIKNEDRRG